MVRTMIDVEQYLSALPAAHRDYTERLAAVKLVLATLGSPQDAVPAVHIAGTSGKGSTAYYAAKLLNDAGYTTGLAVSPHVNSVAERSQVNGEVLPEGSYCAYFNQFISIVDERNLQLSYIEFLVIFTYWLFAELKLDYIVIEVGLGGRLDPTNAIVRDDTVRVVTDIGLDHTEILGDSLMAIAREKAGIIHSGNVVVMHEQSSEVMDAVAVVVSEVDADLIIEHETAIQGSILPIFQQRNWTLAYRAVTERLSLDMKPALSRATPSKSLALVIPGRFERFMYNGVTVVLDAAHNPQKMNALIDGIKSTYPQRGVVCVVAFGDNKRTSTEDSLRVIQSTASTLVVTEFAEEGGVWHSAIPSRDLVSTAQDAGFSGANIVTASNPINALDIAIQLAKQQDLIVIVTGSFYLIDSIRMRLLEDATSPGV